MPDLSVRLIKALCILLIVPPLFSVLSFKFLVLSFELWFFQPHSALCLYFYTSIPYTSVPKSFSLQPGQPLPTANVKPLSFYLQPFTISFLVHPVNLFGWLSKKFEMQGAAHFCKEGYTGSMPEEQKYAATRQIEL